MHVQKHTHTRAQGVHTEKVRYRDVHARPEAYTHVNKGYTPKSAGTGHRCKSRGVNTRALGVHNEKGWNGHVDARPEAYIHVQ